VPEGGYVKRVFHAAYDIPVYSFEQYSVDKRRVRWTTAGDASDQSISISDLSIDDRVALEGMRESCCPRR
jgi:hypothetical protein